MRAAAEARLVAEAMAHLDHLPPQKVDMERQAMEEEERGARRRADMGSAAQQSAVQGAVAEVERAQSSTRGGAVVVDCDAMEEAPSRRRVKEGRAESALEEHISDSYESSSDDGEECTMSSLCASCVGGRVLASAFVCEPLLLLLPSRRLMRRVLRNSAWCLHPR
jgi:hypothetical protein